MTLEEGGNAYLKDLVAMRMAAIGADELVPDARLALTLLGRVRRPEQKKPCVAVISRPSKKMTGELQTHYADASESLLEAIRQAGGIPLIVPETTNLGDIPLLFGEYGPFDGVVVPGTEVSDLDPSWYDEQNHHSENTNYSLDRFDMAVALWCTLIRPMPFLSICLGFQAWTVALGGSLWQDLCQQRGLAVPTQNHSIWKSGHNAEHPITIDPQSQFYHTVGRVREMRTNTLHHQGVHAVAPGLRPVAHSFPDRVVETVEIDQQWRKLMGIRREFALGVQFHPELPVTDPMSAQAMGRIIPALVSAAAN